MKIDYLVWVKDLYQNWIEKRGNTSCINLTSSAIHSPHDLLQPDIIEGIKEHLANPQPWGSERLKNAIAGWAGMDEKNVFVTSGASGALLLVSLTFLRKGDHVIVESPVYEPVHAIPEYIGAEISFISRSFKSNYSVDPEELKAAIRPNTRLILLTNLHNPTGTWLNDEELDSIADEVRRASGKIKVVIDEVYHDFVRDKQSPAALRGEPFITLNSLSKVFGLWITRCGWILASPESVEMLQRTFVLAENVGSPIHESIAESVFSRTDAYEAHWRDLVSANRAIVQEIYSGLLKEGFVQGSLPGDGCIFFPEISGVQDTRTFTQELAEKTGVFIVPGEFFSRPGHVRIGFGGNSAELREGLGRFADFIRRKRR